MLIERTIIHGAGKRENKRNKGLEVPCVVNVTVPFSMKSEVITKDRRMDAN